MPAPAPAPASPQPLPPPPRPLLSPAAPPLPLFAPPLPLFARAVGSTVLCVSLAGSIGLGLRWSDSACRSRTALASAASSAERALRMSNSTWYFNEESFGMRGTESADALRAPSPERPSATPPRLCARRFFSSARLRNVKNGDNSSTGLSP
eukprot:3750962-Pleurochrysis_carterae.AAC.3